MNLKLILSLIFLALIIGFSFFSNQKTLVTKKKQSENRIEKVVSKVGVFPEDCDWQAFDRVVDGDTIRLKSGVKVRYIGINTPEVESPYTTEQFFGPAASAQMHKYLDGAKRVCLIDDMIGNKYDKYDRRLAYVYNESGQNLNLEMLKGGFAKVYRKFKFDHKDEFLEAEQVARSQGLGLWE